MSAANGDRRGVLGAVLTRARALDTRVSRRDGRRRLLVDARTPVNFTMVESVFRVMAGDARLDFYFTASEEPHQMSRIYREARGVTLVDPRWAAFQKFDAYIASDFMWASLPRGTCRIQVFHGVGGKYGFDAPTRSMREWHRLFFVNERRLRNFIAAGAIDHDCPAIRLIGMPKSDCLIDGTFTREAVLADLGLDPSRSTVLYAPTWSPASSLNAMGIELITGLLQLPVNLIVKLHDRSHDPRELYSGGVDWPALIQPLLRPGRAVLAAGHNISPYMVAADVMITDHSSAGFEYLLRDRPLVRIHRPALIELAHIHADYVQLLAAVAESVDDPEGVLRAVERALADPGARSAERRRVAGDLFYKPGGATARAVAALYEALELEPLAAPVEHQTTSCQPSV